MSLLNIDEYKLRLKRKSIKMIPGGKYYGLKRSVYHMCPEGHWFKEKPEKVLRGAKCPECYWWRPK